MARENKWKSAIFKAGEWSTDPTNYYLDTTGGFYTNSLSSSAARMPRVVNGIPYKVGDDIVWHKRPGFDTAGGLQANGISSVYITEDNATQFIFPNTGATFTSAKPKWANTSSDPTNFFWLNPTETYIGTTRNVLAISNEEMSQSPTTHASRYTTAGWFVPADVYGIADFTNGATRQGTMTASSATITGLSSTSDLYVGQVVYSTNFATNNYVYILSIVDADEITVSENATSNSTANLTFFCRCRILDADFPANIVGTAVTGRMVPLNGYVFVMTTAGDIYNSDADSLKNWTVTSYLNAEVFTDGGGAGLMKYRNTLVAFGTSSIEFYRDVGNNLGSVLQKVEELTMHIGCPIAEQTTYLDDTIAFIGTSKEGNAGVYMMDGFSPKRVSTPEIEAYISAAPTYGAQNWQLTSFHMKGKSCLALNPFYGINSTTGVPNTAGWTTFIYFIEDNKWCEWRPPESKTCPWALGGFVSTGSQHRIAGNPWKGSAVATPVTAYTPYVLAINRATGTLTQCTTNNYLYKDHDGTSATNTYNFVVQTPTITLGTNKRKFVRKLRFFDNTSTSYIPSTGLSIYWSDDFGQNWTTRSGVSTQKDFTGLGSFRNRIWRFVENSANEYAISGVELEYKEGQI